MGKIAGQAESAGGAAIGRIERAEAVDDTLIDRALRHLIGRIPAVGIGHRRQGEPVGRGAPAVTQYAVQLADIVGHIPRAAVCVGFKCCEQRACGDRGRARGQRALITKAAKGQLGDVLRELVDIVDADRAGGSEIALVGVIRPFADVDRLHELRN